MTPNVGGDDRTMRLAAAAILALLGVTALLGVVPLGTFAGSVVLATGGILGVTGLLRWCPVNALVGIDTCATDDPE